jgi:hypothetical protein
MITFLKKMMCSSLRGTANPEMMLKRMRIRIYKVGGKKKIRVEWIGLTLLGYQEVQLLH